MTGWRVGGDARGLAIVELRGGKYVRHYGGVKDRREKPKIRRARNTQRKRTQIEDVV